MGESTWWEYTAVSQVIKVSMDVGMSMVSKSSLRRVGWGTASSTSSPACRRGNIPESRSLEEAVLWGPECCIKSSADEAVLTSYFSNVGICVLQNREKNAIQVESMWGLKVGMILILSSFRSVHTFSFNHAVL